MFFRGLFLSHAVLRIEEEKEANVSRGSNDCQLFDGCQSWGVQPRKI
jgi:hypothetical protein